ATTADSLRCSSARPVARPSTATTSSISVAGRRPCRRLRPPVRTADTMLLLPATEGHVLSMMAWFPDRRSCDVWGGQKFRYPFTADTFLEDSRSRVLPSYVLVGEAGELLAFGQYYLRAGRCHLGRLV